MFRQHLHQEWGESDASATANGLQLARIAPVVPDPVKGSDYQESSSVEIKACSPNAGELAPTKAEVGARVDESAIAAIDGFCQASDLDGAEIAWLGAGLSGQ